MQTPFSVIDELNCYYDAPDEPNNLHLEIQLPGQLSADAFRNAAGKALADIPRARARRVRHRGKFHWQTDPDLRVEDLVSHVTWASTEDLDRQRAAFVSRPIQLDTAGPLRLLLASGPAQTCVMLSAHHAALDGMSALNLLRSVATAYTGTSAGSEHADRRTRRPLATGPESRPRQTRPRVRVTRIAAEPSASTAGYGIAMLRPMPAPPARTGTVNDVLITALIVTIGRWNAAHGKRAANIRVTVPVNERVPGQPFETGNDTRLAVVTGQWADSTAGILDSVTRQTRWAKNHAGPPVAVVLRSLAAVPLPSMVKRGALRLSLRTLGPLRCDTTLLTNLGNITAAPRFGDLSATAIAVSAPAHMPRGLSVGAASLGGELQLCVRYRRSLLTDEAGARFSDLLAATLTELS
jgi:NRPS condensation-like uncharacterized protein